MRSIFGSLPNITWARIIATVFEKAEAQMGDFDVDNYRRWAAADWDNAHGAGPGKLGCPWKGCASRELPKGANGVKPSKPMHDDDNGVISLGCWTSMTEALPQSGRLNVVPEVDRGRPAARDGTREELSRRLCDQG